MSSTRAHCTRLALPGCTPGRRGLASTLAKLQMVPAATHGSQLAKLRRIRGAARGQCLLTKNCLTRPRVAKPKTGNLGIWHRGACSASYRHASTNTSRRRRAPPWRTPPGRNCSGLRRSVGFLTISPIPITPFALLRTANLRAAPIQSLTPRANTSPASTSWQLYASWSRSDTQTASTSSSFPVSGHAPRASSSPTTRYASKIVGIFFCLFLLGLGRALLTTPSPPRAGLARAAPCMNAVTPADRPVVVHQGF